MPGRVDGRGGAPGRPGVRRGPAVREQRVVRRVRGDRAESRVPGRQDRHESGDASGPAHRAAGAPAGRPRRGHHADGSAGGVGEQQPVPHRRPVRPGAARAAGLGDAGRPRREGGGRDQRGRAAAEPGPGGADGAGRAGGGRRGGPGRDRGGRRRRGDGPARAGPLPRRPGRAARPRPPQTPGRRPGPPRLDWRRLRKLAATVGRTAAPTHLHWPRHRSRHQEDHRETTPRAARPAPEHATCRNVRHRCRPREAGPGPCLDGQARRAGADDVEHPHGRAARHALPPSAVGAGERPPARGRGPPGSTPPLGLAVLCRDRPPHQASGASPPCLPPGTPDSGTVQPDTGQPPGCRPDLTSAAAAVPPPPSPR